MAATVSTVPAVLDALVALARQALPDTQVFDGPPFEEQQGDLVFVGWVPNGAPAVTDTRTRQQYATSPDTESYDVSNTFCSWPGGDTDVKACRDRAYGMVDAFAEALVDSDRLGGLVKRLRISTDAYIPEGTTAGASATVLVTVHVDANTRSR